MYKTYTRILILCLVILCACNKKPGTKPISPPIDPATTLLTLDVDHPGNPIPGNFQGLSFENWLLSRNPEFLDGNNAALVQLLKNLGPGVIRMGGNSSDETDWTDDGFNPDSHFDILTKAHIDKLADFSEKTNWKVIFGLNLGHYNIDASVDEAKYLYAKLGANLYALQIGNEPDYYKLGYRDKTYSVNDFEREWFANYTSIKAQLPNVQFAGPDVSDNLLWVNAFAADNYNNISLLDAHYYNDGPATDSSINCQTILSGDDSMLSYLQSLDQNSKTAGLHYRITETNSIWGGGKPGVSDSFAATLWALDLMWSIAANNGQGINFHGGELNYSPISVTNGTTTANAVYYAMLAFKYGASDGPVIPVIGDAAQGDLYSAFASKTTNGGYSMTIINKDQYKDITFTVKAGKNVNNIDVMRLKAPKVDAKTGITFGGSSVNSDGSFAPAATETHQIGSTNFVIKIPAASAAVVTIN